MAMSLAALSRHDLPTARSILAATAGAIDAYPIQDASERLYGAEINEVLHEIRASLKLREDDTSSKAKSRISSAVYEAMKRALFIDRSLEEVTADLGARGDLPLSGYEILIRPRLLEDFSEQEKLVRQWIRTSDVIQHVQTPAQDAFIKSYEHDRGVTILDMEQLRHSTGTTLITKRLVSKKGVVSWVLFHCLRDKAQLSVNSVLRAIPSVVDVDKSGTPVDLLRAIVAVYGLPFRIPGVCSTTTLLEDHPVRAAYQSSAPIVDSDRQFRYIETGEDMTFAPTQPGFPKVQDKRIMFAYAIDLRRYLADKVRAG